MKKVQLHDRKSLFNLNNQSIDGSVVECSPANLEADRGRPGFDSRSMHFYSILPFMESSNTVKDRRYRIVPVIAENTANLPASPKHETTLRGFRFRLETSHSTFYLL